MSTSNGRLLLTGATGFIGGAIAAQLAAGKRWQDVLFLVRAADAGEGLRRVDDVLRRYGVSVYQGRRVSTEQIVCGDLCSVESFAGDRRLREVSDVINCAAFASFSGHPQIFATNVDGTLAFARAISRAARLRRFVQVGAAMCCGPDAPKLVPEGYEPAPGTAQLVPYTRSKLEAERRLRAELPELPLVLARPNIVIGHTRLGCVPSPSIFWVFRVARALRRFPCPADALIDVIPVDYCAEALLHLVDRPRLRHDTYQISSGPQASCTFREIDGAIASALDETPLHDYRHVDYAAIEAEQDRFTELFGPCVRPLMLRAIRLYGAFAGLGMVFDNRRLLGEGMAPPPRFTDYAGLCALTAAGAPIASQMQYDFKGARFRLTADKPL